MRCCVYNGCHINTLFKTSFYQILNVDGRFSNRRLFLASITHFNKNTIKFPVLSTEEKTLFANRTQAYSCIGAFLTLMNLIAFVCNFRWRTSISNTKSWKRAYTNLLIPTSLPPIWVLSTILCWTMWFRFWKKRPKIRTLTSMVTADC